MSIDFENKKYLKLKRADDGEYADLLGGTLPSGESILQTYKAGRDGVVFTDKRMFCINTQGVTGKQKAITVIPYAQIAAYEVQTASVIDVDGTLTVWVNGLGEFTLEFTARTDLGAICRCINLCNDRSGNWTGGGAFNRGVA